MVLTEPSLCFRRRIAFLVSHPVDRSRPCRPAREPARRLRRSSAMAGAAPGPLLLLVVVAGAGDLTAVLARYRQLLGPDNGAAPGSKPSGRREINWTGRAGCAAAPHSLPPGDFFTGRRRRAREGRSSARRAKASRPARRPAIQPARRSASAI